MFLIDNIKKRTGLSLSESMASAATVDGGILLEDVINLKKHPRDVKTAKEEARAAAITGFNPYDNIYKLHVKAMKKAIQFVQREFKDAKKEQDKITFSANYIDHKLFTQPKNGVMVIGVHIYMPAKKGFLGRLFTGSMGNWFCDVGVKALRIYVEMFAGEIFAKQVTKKTVFNATAEGSNEGKTSYFVCMKIPQSND